jgi:hypothetical protein
VSIVRVGLAETKKFSAGYEAIFGKKGPAAPKKRPAGKKARPAAKVRKAKKK